MRRLLILSRAEAPDEPVQGGEYHASPPVGLQAPVVSLVVSLPEDSVAGEEEEAGGLSTGLAGTTTGAGGVEETAGDVMVGEGASGAAAAVVNGAAGPSWFFPASPGQE